MNDSFCPPVVVGFCTVGGLSSGLPSPPQATSTKAARPATIVLAGLARVIKRAERVKAYCIRC